MLCLVVVVVVVVVVVEVAQHVDVSTVLSTVKIRC